MNRLVFGALAVAGGVAAYQEIVRPWWRTWGVDERGATRPLPGDDIVATATAVETRSLEIDATPSAVWPWLLQMGYGRAGWYSYDQIDMAGASVRRIVPEWQTLDVGDIVPTHPGGGFEVRVIEPEHALVLYSDAAIVAQQAEAARVARVDRAAPTSRRQERSSVLRSRRTSPPAGDSFWSRWMADERG